MPRSKQALFGVSTTDVKPEKLPTIAQYIKSTSSGERVTRSMVDLVWLPGKFKNYTLQTEDFRVIITPNNPLFSGIKSYFEHIPDLPCEMFVEITDPKLGAYMLTEGAEHTGIWEAVGQSGFRWVE